MEEGLAHLEKLGLLFQGWASQSGQGIPIRPGTPDSVPLCHTDLRACPVSEDLGVPKALKVG